MFSQFVCLIIWTCCTNFKISILLRNVRTTIYTSHAMIKHSFEILRIGSRGSNLGRSSCNNQRSISNINSTVEMRHLHTNIPMFLLGFF
jgi:hypothetical protein